MRHPAAALVLAAVTLGLLAAPSGAATVASGSYAVHVLPDPTEPAGLYGRCGTIDGAVLGQRIGQDYRRLRMPAAGTLTVGTVPRANVFAGDLGTNWLVKLYDARLRPLATSTGPAWRHRATVRLARAQDVVVVVCNRWGHPDARVYWDLTR
jgi:hypothetical protein